jgi:tungstate transport system substrate-binding protein
VRTRAALLVTVALAALLLAAAAGCGSGSSGASGKKGSIILATTTSTEDSGILSEFVKEFQASYPYSVKAVAVGSGAALFMGSNGDADIMITHEPKAEKQFLSDGNAASYDKLMHNDFLIVGPASDPAHIKGMKDGVEAVKAIAATKSPFVSRGDASGTNAMEMTLWQRAGITPAPPWYISAGQGMGETLRIANEKQAYALTDRASFTVLAGALDLKPMVQGDPTMLNQYTVTVVNHSKFPGTNYAGALALKKFLESAATKKMISGFGWNQYKVHLFIPD